MLTQFHRTPTVLSVPLTITRYISISTFPLLGWLVIQARTLHSRVYPTSIFMYIYKLIIMLATQQKRSFSGAINARPESGCV